MTPFDVRDSEKRHDATVARSMEMWAGAGFSVHMAPAQQEGFDFTATRDGTTYFIEVKATGLRNRWSLGLSRAQRRFRDEHPSVTVGELWRVADEVYTMARRVMTISPATPLPSGISLTAVTDTGGVGVGQYPGNRYMAVAMSMDEWMGRGFSVYLPPSKTDAYYDFRVEGRNGAFYVVVRVGRHARYSRRVLEFGRSHAQEVYAERWVLEEDRWRCASRRRGLPTPMANILGPRPEVEIPTA